MKKKVLLTVLCLIMVLSFSACGGGGGDKAISMEGKWVISEMMLGDQDYLQMMKDLGESMGEEMDLTTMFYCEFKPDNVFVMTMDTDSAEGTYEIKGDKLTLTVDDEPQVATLDGDTFTIEVEEEGETMTMSFTKQ